MSYNYDRDVQRMTILARRLYQFLDSNQFFKKQPEFDPDTEWSIRERTNLQYYGNCRALSFLEQRDAVFFNLSKKHDSFGTFEREKEVMPFVLLAECAHSEFEIMKRLLLFGLDLKKIGPKLGKRSTYGRIISELEKKGLESSIVTGMDNELRNIMAHGSWFVKDRMFVDHDEGIKLTYDDFEKRVDRFRRFAGSFYDLYWQNHTPKNAIEYTVKKFIRPDA